MTSPDKYRPTTWRRETVELELPSGQFCLVRPIDVATLMAESGLNDFDILTGHAVQDVAKKSKSAKRRPEKSAEDIARDVLSDPDMLNKTRSLMDKTLLACVVLPKISRPPEDPDAERDPDIGYLDQIPLADKTYVFNWAMTGVVNLESFREELRVVGSGLESQQSRPLPPE